MMKLFPLSYRSLLLLLASVGMLSGACTANLPFATSTNRLEQDVEASQDGDAESDLDSGVEELLANHVPSDFDPFRDAVNTAIKATEMNESAETTEDWRKIAETWQLAIELMKAVPKSHEKYDVAQQRALEAYPKNLAYAQGKAGEDALPDFTTDDAKMTKVDFGEGWPFVVDGEVRCERISAGEYVVDLVTLHSLERVYAVNLPAQSRAEEKGWQTIDEIWRDSPFGSGKVPINWVIWRGEALCEQPLEAQEDVESEAEDEAENGNDSAGDTTNQDDES